MAAGTVTGSVAIPPSPVTKPVAAANRTCVQTAAKVPNLPSASRTVSLGNQQLAVLLGEELRIRARDVAFERAVVASRGVS